MQNKFKAIINRVSTQYNKTHLCSGVACFRSFVADSGKKLAKAGVSANVISIAGFIIGMFAVNFLALNMYFWALVCILLNRWCDALDGAVAKINGKTEFGVFLDACLDYIFYAAVIFGFALAQPQNATSAAFLLFGFTASAAAMLAYAVVAYGHGKNSDGMLQESPFYLGGLAQGAETLAALVILCLVPVWFVPIALILGCWCLVKSLVVISTAYYAFVVAKKGSK